MFKDIPGYDTVLLSHLIAFGSCLVAVLFIIVLYREGVRGWMPLPAHMHVRFGPITKNAPDTE